MQTILNINGFETPVEIPTDFPSKCPEVRDNVIDYGNDVLRIYGKVEVPCSGTDHEGFVPMEFNVRKILHVSVTPLDVASVVKETAHVANLTNTTFSIGASANKDTTVTVMYAVDALM